MSERSITPGGSRRARRPNILVVMPDQMRRHACGFMGDPNVRTPALDRVAAEGVVFDAMCSTFPACVPFRFSFVTGAFAHTRAVPSLGYRLSPAERTIGEALGAEGHATAWIGKWHLYSLYGTRGGQTLAQSCRTPIPPAWRRGFDHWQGFELRNDVYDTWYFEGDQRRPRRLEGYQTDALTDLALGYFAARRGRAEPFFLVLSVEPPHPPFVAPAADLRRVAARGPLHLRPNVDVDAIRFFPPEWREPANPAGAVRDGGDLETSFTANMQAYYAMIENLDANLARLLAGLVEHRLADDTVVLFLSDHGELGGAHGLLGKAEPFEESIGVPLVAWSANEHLVAPAQVYGPGRRGRRRALAAVRPGGRPLRADQPGRRPGLRRHGGRAARQARRPPRDERRRLRPETRLRRPRLQPARTLMRGPMEGLTRPAARPR